MHDWGTICSQSPLQKCIFFLNASIHLVTVGNSISDNYKELKKYALCSTVRIRDIMYIYMHLDLD